MDSSRSARHETAASHVGGRRLALRNDTATSRKHRAGTDALLADGKCDGGCGGGIADLLVLVS
jgi:hypothetical protein